MYISFPTEPENIPSQFHRTAVFWSQLQMQIMISCSVLPEDCQVEVQGVPSQWKQARLFGLNTDISLFDIIEVST